MTAPEGPDIDDENAALYLDAPQPLTATITSNAELEAVVTRVRDIDGVVLRYGFLYGPGTYYAPDGAFVKQIRGGAFPIVGTGEGRFQFIHVDDAAAATVLALDRGSTGIYNVVGDDPAPMHEWVPYVAQLIGAPPPAAISVECAEREIGHQLVYYGTQLRGASNDKARRDLGFSPSTRTGGRRPSSRAAPRQSV